MIYIGADHRGFELKEQLKNWLQENEYEVEDVGNHVFDPEDDYIDPAIRVAEMIQGGSDQDRGILLCGSGHGVEIVANRFTSVRAVLGYNDEVSVQGRAHEDANILVLPTDWVECEDAIERVRAFLQTEVDNAERHLRRRSRLQNMRVA